MTIDRDIHLPREATAVTPVSYSVRQNQHDGVHEFCIFGYRNILIPGIQPRNPQDIEHPHVQYACVFD